MRDSGSGWGGLRYRRRLPALAAVPALILALGSCQPAGAPVETVKQGAEVVRDSVPRARISIEPGQKARRVRPDAPVRVSAADGRLKTVRVVSDAGRRLAGALSPDGTRWVSTERLAFASGYRVTARAVDGAARLTSASSRFRTLRPDSLVRARIAPLDGETVGVGMPIVVYLTAPVSDKAAVERRLRVDTSRAVVGRWHWVSDTEVHYRPRTFWPAGTRVSLSVPLAGVHAGGGVWGDEDRRIGFRVGPAMVSTIDVDRYRMTVTRDGEVLRTVPVSTGKAGYLTRGGTKVVLSKEEDRVMDAATVGIDEGDPEYYRLNVKYAVRVTWSGEFIHAAPWSVGSQGSANVSHGCVGMSTEDAAWFFALTQRGDVVNVVGSDRELEPGNGFTDWNVPWREWVTGSALT